MCNNVEMSAPVLHISRVYYSVIWTKKGENTMKLRFGLLFVMLVFALPLAACQNSGSGNTGGHEEHHTKDHSEMKKKTLILFRVISISGPKRGSW